MELGWLLALYYLLSGCSRLLLTKLVEGGLDASHDLLGLALTVVLLGLRRCLWLLLLLGCLLNLLLHIHHRSCLSHRVRSETLSSSWLEILLHLGSLLVGLWLWLWLLLVYCELWLLAEGLVSLSSDSSCLRLLLWFDLLLGLHDLHWLLLLLLCRVQNSCNLNLWLSRLLLKTSDTLLLCGLLSSWIDGTTVLHGTNDAWLLSNEGLLGNHSTSLLGCCDSRLLWSCSLNLRLLLLLHLLGFLTLLFSLFDTPLSIFFLSFLLFLIS